MTPVKLWIACLVLVFPTFAAVADSFDYASIASRYQDVRLASRAVKTAEMHGECLVGLKQLIFVKRDKIDPVAEWINYRSLSLLEQFPPCDVLIMMQVARDELASDGVGD